MTDRDNVKMEINIAGEQIILTVPFSKQEATRKTEKDVDALYNDWKMKFPKKNPKELLAMIAYQYASFYDDLRQRYDRAAQEAAKANALLDSLLKK